MAMATRWSSESVVAEHRDLQASAMAIDWTGVHLLLAGRKCLALKNLGDSSDTLQRIPRNSKYEVGTAEWNPSSTNQHLCAVSSNNRVEIWTLRPDSDLTPTHSLRSHTRVVTDLNWHKFDPNLLASSSIDTFIHLWDVREQRRPTLSLSAVASATQVRWNRFSSYILATAHDGDIKLWDRRKGTAPVQYIAAHLSKIHGLDWSPTNEHQIATSSQDCTVKLFDTTNPRRAEKIITTPNPVWRARYTPFGDGLVTVVVPQLRRGENSLLLWNRTSPTAPVYTFVGHTDVVLEFEWRKPHDDSANYQLITWSKDQSLRIWTVEPFLQKLCGSSEEDTSSVEDIPDLDEEALKQADFVVESPYPHPTQPASSENAAGKTDALNGVTEEASEQVMESSASTTSSVSERDVNPSPTQPKTLQQEFSLINVNIPNIQLEAMDVARRCCTVTAISSGLVVILHVSFPPSYPFNAAPSFQFGQGTTVDSTAMAKILKVLRQTAQQRVRTNKSCLEPCLRQLVMTLDQFAYEDSENKTKLRPSSAPFFEPSNMYGSFKDAYIPFPRTSGAKFGSVGLLVCFGRPPFARRLSTRLESPTPRSLSALGGNFNSFSLNVGGGGSTQYAHGAFPAATQGALPQLRTRAVSTPGKSSRSSSSSSQPSATKAISGKAVVTIYDTSALFPMVRELGEKYVFDYVDIAGMCHRNASICASIGRRDLVQVWTMAALAATPAVGSDPDDEVQWPLHPCGRSMLESLITFYAKQRDIQTAAMLTCAFGCRTENLQADKKHHSSKSVNVSPGGSPYHTIHQVDSSLEGWNYPPMVKQNRSNSWSDSLDDFRLSATIVEHKEVKDTAPRGAERPEKQLYRMLDEANAHEYDGYKRAYAEILHRWSLLDARAQVLKYLSTTPEAHRGVDFFTECRECNKQVHGASCLFCKHLVFQCSICHISVRGSSNFCLVCGHGGHTNHIISWFETESVCPTGCGCNCLIETAAVLAP